MREWICGVCAAGILCGICKALAGKGKVSRILELVCAAVLIIKLVAPIKSLDLQRLPEYLVRYSSEYALAAQKYSEENKTIQASIIAESFQAYILERGAELGIKLKSDVTVGERDGKLCPISVRITLDKKYDEKKLARLAEEISAKCAIEHQAQEYVTE